MVCMVVFRPVAAWENLAHHQCCRGMIACLWWSCAQPPGPIDNTPLLSNAEAEALRPGLKKGSSST
jgi:hypothetical protein